MPASMAMLYLQDDGGNFVSY